MPIALNLCIIIRRLTTDMMIYFCLFPVSLLFHPYEILCIVLQCRKYPKILKIMDNIFCLCQTIAIGYSYAHRLYVRSNKFSLQEVSLFRSIPVLINSTTNFITYAAVIYYCVYVKRKAIVSLNSKILFIVSDILRVPYAHIKHVLVLSTSVQVLVFVAIICFVLLVSYEHRNELMPINLLVQNAVHITFVMQYINTIIVIRICFVIVNKNIRQMSSNGKCELIKSVRNVRNESESSESTHFTVERLHKAYFATEEMVNALNSVYGETCAVLLAAVYSCLISDLYIIIITIWRTGESMSHLSLIVGLSVFHATKLVAIISTCALTCSEALATLPLVHRLQIMHPEDLSLRLFYQKLTHSILRVKFTAGRLFDINWPLLVTVVAAASTQLVLLCNL